MVTFFAGQRLLAADLQRIMPLVVYKTANETVNNSAGYQDDNHLALTLEANATYECWLHGIYSSGTTPDLKYQFSKPSGATLADWSVLAYNTASALAFGVAPAGDFTPGGLTGTTTFDSWGLVTTTNAGTLRVQWAQNTANASDTIMRAGSYLRALRIA